MPTKKKKQSKTTETDGAYFLKLVLYVVLGSFWLRFSEPVSLGNLVLYGLPLGLPIGLIFASHDHFQIDRKIEYAVLVIMAVVGFIVPYLGIFI